jgi:predicted RNase H-like nuclease (RuvC/YqgF family)
MRRYDVETGLPPEVAEKLKRVMREYEEKIEMLVQENQQLRDVITNLQDQIGQLKDRLRPTL